MLHLLAHTPSDPKFELGISSILAAKSPATLVLYQDAVYILGNGYQHSGFYQLLQQVPKQVTIYAIAEDLLLRGLTLEASNPVTSISYAEFVDITMGISSVTW